MRRLILALCILALAGCVTMAKVDTGKQVIGDRLTLKIEGAWNHLEAPGLGPAQTWTMEGLPIDQLLIYSGIKDGELMHAHRGGKKDFVFHATMQPDEIVSMFEGMLTSGGSSFKLTRLAPSTFGGLKGFRFEFTQIRKVDDVVRLGVGWGCVSRGELFAMLYLAPRLVFFKRHEREVEKIAMSARVQQ